MNRPRTLRTGQLWNALGFLGGAAGVMALVSCGTVGRTVLAPPEIAGASYVGNSACFECHTNYVRHFAGSPHARIHVPSAGPGALSGCESCHGPGSLHVQAGGSHGRSIVNPGRDPAACFRCHQDTHAEFRLPQHHPVLEGRMNCVQCHDPHGSEILKPARGLAMARLNESCAECHREQARPVVFEHEAMREGCTACHAPHGSINAKMLTARDNNLCLRCHAQVQGPSVPAGGLYIGAVNHGLFVQRGACWSAGCHTAIHGSNVNPHMLY